MSEANARPYGSWTSPITSDLIASATIRLGDLAVDGDDVYWSESRPAEGGRSAIVRRTPDGQTADLIPAPFNARTRVHEYGGAAFAVAVGNVYFSNFADQRLYRVRPGRSEAPVAVTPEGPWRYADGVVDRARNRLVCVLEDHSAEGHEPVNCVAAVDLATGQHTVLISGADFYSNPRLSPDGRRLCWLAWRHPNMPWDGCELWIGELEEDGSVGYQERVAGGPAESIYQPDWSPAGVLHYVSDRSGWWNLYRWHRGASEPLRPAEAEFGQPQWSFGTATYGFESATSLVCAYVERGSSRLARLDTATGQLTPIETTFTDISDIRVQGSRAILKAGSPTEASAIVLLDAAGGQGDALRRSSSLRIDPAYLSIPEPIEFPTAGGLTAHGFYYAPRNKDAAGPAGERPPLLVKSHGGPTGSTSTTLSATIQFWTSRGIAVLDVNYGGSTGYGRAYRARLDDAWGIVDVDDCVNGALYLVRRGDVDGDRLLIDGGSAGGYTTLAVLTFRDQFKAGASYYGVSDLEALAKETHKFESRYLDRLVGPYPGRRDLYVERSPINHVARLSCPIVFFQGLEDRVVPPNQAEMMVEALRKKGLPVAYVAYEGEQHGFRRAENIKRSLDVELYFYGRILGFEPADHINPLPAIENLP
jgi:dipeptidyl aminopeptidase/acylaminoacyl peptidase